MNILFRVRGHFIKIQYPCMFSTQNIIYNIQKKNILLKIKHYVSGNIKAGKYRSTSTMNHALKRKNYNENYNKKPYSQVKETKKLTLCYVLLE